MTAQADGGIDVAAVATNASQATAAVQRWWVRVSSDRRVRFLFTGGLNTLFGFACFAAFHATVGVRWGYMWALLLSHLTTVLFAFFTHRRLTFQVTGSIVRDLWRFESVYLVALGVNALMLPALVEWGHAPVLVAQGVVTVANAFISWLGHSRFSFRRAEVNP